MKIKLDECITVDALAVFARHGHDVHTVGTEDLIGTLLILTSEQVRIRRPKTN